MHLKNSDPGRVGFTTQTKRFDDLYNSCMYIIEVFDFVLTFSHF